MNTPHSLSRWLSQVRAQLRRWIPPEFDQLWLFWLLLTLSILIMYYWAVTSLPDLRQPGRLALFTALLLAHLILYWAITWVLKHARWLTLFLAVQAALIFTVTYLSSGTGLLYGLYIGLIGLCAGTFKWQWKTAVWILVIYVLSATNYILIYGASSLRSWFLIMVSLTVFVVGYILMFLFQLESRQRAQALLAELEIAHRQLTEYSARVAELTLANERQRMARELHDTLAQGLAGLTLQLEAAQAHLAQQHPERAQAIIQQAMERARATMTDARRVIDDLRTAPSSPDDVDEAIHQEVDRFTQATNLPCDVRLAMPGDLPGGLRQNLVRMVAEGLTNIARYAQASRAAVSLSYDDRNLDLVIQDDGVGFDPHAAEDQPGHYGLLGMRERARLAGGSLEITSAPHQGTTLRIRLPRKKEKQCE